MSSNFGNTALFAKLTYAEAKLEEANMAKTATILAEARAISGELLEALEALYNDTIDYITINKLSGAENNHVLVRAREALSKARTQP